MNIFYIFLIVGIIAVFELGKDLFKRFSNKKNNQYLQAGFNQAVTHIYNQVKEKGKIDLVLDGNKLTIVALKKNNGSNN